MQRGKCQAPKPHHLPVLLPTALWGAGPSVLTPPPLPLPCPGPGGHLMLPRKVHLARSPLLASGLALQAPDLITAPPPFSSTHNSPHCCYRKVIWPLEAASQADSPALGSGGEQLSPGKTAGPILGPSRGNGEGVMDGEQGLKELGVSVLEERLLAA